MREAVGKFNFFLPDFFPLVAFLKGLLTPFMPLDEDMLPNFDVEDGYCWLN